MSEVRPVRVIAGLCAILAATVFAASGCSKSGSNSKADSGATVLDSTAGEPSTSEPATEATSVEAPPTNTGAKAVSVSLPGLPIGGNAVPSADGTAQCAQVAWSGPPSIPDGFSVALDTIALTPKDAFVRNDSACGTDSPLCSDPTFRLSSTTTCVVGVGWTGTPVRGDAYLSVDAGTVTCPTGQARACNDFAKAVASAGRQVIELSGPPESPSTSAPAS